MPFSGPATSGRRLRRPSPTTDDDESGSARSTVFSSDDDRDAGFLPSPRPTKRSKIAHSSASSIIPSPVGNNSAFSVDTRGIRDELVVAVIRHLETTGNHPVPARELAGLMSSRFDAVRQSPKPTVLVSSRLTAYLKRSWSALAPCPLAKVGPAGQVSYYLANHPRRGTDLGLAGDPSEVDFDSESDLDLTATREDFLPALSASQTDTDDSTSLEDTDDEPDQADQMSPYISPVEADDSNPIFSSGPDSLDPDYPGLLLGQPAFFPPIDRAGQSAADRMVYALPLLDAIETEFHQAAAKTRSRRLADREPPVTGTAPVVDDVTPLFGAQFSTGLFDSALGSF